MNTFKQKRHKRIRRHARVRAKVSGTALRPRLCVYRSNRFMHVALIDDEKGVTITGFLSNKLKGSKSEQAELAGKQIAEMAKNHKIAEVVFDRNGFIFGGRVKALAEGARKEGLLF